MDKFDQRSNTAHVPLVSIMMPCFNARNTLPWALASVLAQSWTDWELVIVDDGSTDHPEEIIHKLHDSRIRLIRLPVNKGRGVARQVALENARGEFLCMLDADDWMYPTRISTQAELLVAHSQVALVSSGLAVVDKQQHLTGVRSTGAEKVIEPFLGAKCPVAHASSMFRSSIVGGKQYDDNLKLGEDVDFLVRLLQGQGYMIMKTALYAYGELESVTAAKAASAMKFTRLQAQRRLAQRPVEALRTIAWSYVKQLTYLAISRLGMDEWILRRRNRKPSSEEVAGHAQARETVARIVSQRFSNQQRDAESPV